MIPHRRMPPMTEPSREVPVALMMRRVIRMRIKGEIHRRMTSEGMNDTATRE